MTEQTELKSLREILDVAILEGSTDIQIQKEAVFFRIGGYTEKTPYVLKSEEEIDRIAISSLETILNEGQGAIDYAFDYNHKENKYRIRTNKHKVDGEWEYTFRIIPYTPLSFDQLNLPNRLMRLVELHDGLVLVTGATCAGKTTTTMSLVDIIAKKGGRTIITIEQPVEYKIIAPESCIKQREVGKDVPSFEEGVKQALRQNPDVIVVGELRDASTAIATMQAANSGHLVFCTIHAHSIEGAIQKFAGFISGVSKYAFNDISLSLRAVVDQRLQISSSGKRIPSVKTLFVDSAAVRNMLKENKIINLEEYIET